MTKRTVEPNGKTETQQQVECKENDKKMFYCEICDKVSVKLSDRMAHDRNSAHINNCIEYRHNIVRNGDQLKLMAKLLKDKLNFDPSNLEELSARVVHVLAKQHLTSKQISEIRERKKKHESASATSTTISTTATEPITQSIQLESKKKNKNDK